VEYVAYSFGVTGKQNQYTLCVLCASSGAGGETNNSMYMGKITKSSFDTVHRGKPISLFELKNRNGVTAHITNYGAIVVSIIVPDRNGNLADIVLGYDTIGQYLAGNDAYMGAVCGRCANRIAGGKFTLAGKEYRLAVNNGPNHLHGGNIGFDSVVWDVVQASPDRLQLEYLSPDGEEGYPGELKASVTYSVTDDNSLAIDYEAAANAATVVNLTSHSYFNLAGEGSGDVLNQRLKIHGDYFTPIDETSIPTGEIRPVKDTPMDFTESTAIGNAIGVDEEQLRYGNGYDHNWVLNHPPGKLGIAATAYDPPSGRVMEVCTTQLGLQLYTANWLSVEKGKGCIEYSSREAFCLETQHFPDAVNKPHFPSTILIPGDVYRHRCIYKFGVCA